MPQELMQGQRVRVSHDCPLTLPAYARVLIGVIIGPTADGLIAVRFSDEHEFPLPAKWLEPVPDEQP